MNNATFNSIKKQNHTFLIIIFLFVIITNNIYPQNKIEETNKEEINKEEINKEEINKEEINKEEKPTQTSIQFKISDLTMKGKIEEAYKQYEILIENYPSIINYRDFAEFCAKNKKYKKAKEFYLKGYPNFYQSFYRLESIFYKYQMYEEWLDILLEKHKNKQTDISINSRILVLYHTFEQYKKAADFSFKCMLFNDQYKEYYINSLIKISKKEDMLDYIVNDVLENKSKLKLSKEQENTIIYIKAFIYYYNKKYDEAIPIFREIIKDKQISYKKLENIISSLNEVGEYENAIKIIDYYNEINKNSIYEKELNFKKSELLISQKKYDEAITLLQKLLDSKNRYHVYRASYLLGLLYKEIKDYKKAKEYFLKNKTFKRKNNDLNISYCFIIEDNYEEAKKILLRYPHDSYALYLLAILYLLEDDVSNSIATFEKISNLSVPSTESGEAIENLNILYRISIKKDQLKLYKQFHKLKLKDRYDELLKEYDNFIKNANGFMKDFYNNYFADLFIKNKDYEKALKVLTELSYNGMDDFYGQRANYLLGKLYIKELDKKDEGKKILLEILKHNPNNIYADDIRELLKE